MVELRRGRGRGRRRHRGHGHGRGRHRGRGHGRGSSRDLGRVVVTGVAAVLDVVGGDDVDGDDVGGGEVVWVFGFAEGVGGSDLLPTATEEVLFAFVLVLFFLDAPGFFQDVLPVVALK